MINIKLEGRTVCAMFYLYLCASIRRFLFRKQVLLMQNIKAKAACSCKTGGEKPGVIFAATVGCDSNNTVFMATEVHACSFARGD